MPFDGPPPPREQPGRRERAPSDTAITVLIVVITAVLLAMPISLAALVDLVGSVQHR